MVALLHDSPVVGRSGSARGHLRLVDGGRGRPVRPVRRAEVGERSADAQASVPSLRLVPGVEASARPGLVTVIVVAVAVFGLLGLLRWIQAPAGSDLSVPAPSVGAPVVAATPAPGDQVVVAQAGDSLWSIASDLAPQGDRRPVVAALIEANGGESLQIGQQIVIPGHLLD